MTTEEINKGSRLIKELMGSTIKVAQDDVKDIPLAFLTIEDMKFHLSWKWLMPVVIKIEEEFDIPVLIQSTSCMIETESGDNFHNQADTKLLAIWHTVVEFLDAQ
jgi:hypothetical protein